MVFEIRKSDILSVQNSEYYGVNSIVTRPNVFEKLNSAAPHPPHTSGTATDVTIKGIIEKFLVLENTRQK